MSARTILKHVYENGGMTEYQYERIDRVLKERERPHGKWKNDRMEMHTLHFGECSKCREKCVIGNFCMWCGSDNREKEGERA